MRRVPYRYRLYQPIVGEPALRMKLRRLHGRVTVPVLTTDDGEVLADSLEIARWSDGRGEGPTLFPPEHADANLSGVPALVVNGTMDPATPAADAEVVASAQPRSQRLIVRGAGHGVSSPCIGGIVAAFLDRPLAKVDTSCVAAATAP